MDLTQNNLISLNSALFINEKNKRNYEIKKGNNIHNVIVYGKSLNIGDNRRSIVMYYENRRIEIK